MSAIRLLSRALLVSVCICASASAADKKAGDAKNKPAKKPITVVFKKDNVKVELMNLEIGVEDRGLFGTSFSELEKLPVKTDKLKLKVPLKNLTKIEVVSVKKDGKKITEVVLRLTAANKEPLTAQVDSEKPLTWKATHSFADAEVTLELDKIKAIILVPEK